MALLEKTRLYLGLDASAVTAAAVGEGLGGRRVRGFARMPLGPGALAPSPSGQNLLRGDEARAAIRRAVSDLGGGRFTLVLPDGVARVALLELPEGAPPRDYVLYRLAASLPFPAGEAIVDALPAGGRVVVGAAVRRATVAEYEQSASGVGVEVERVHLAPLVALAGLLRAGARDAVHVVLGDVALCLAAFHEGVPAVLRSRRRDRSAGEASRLLEEASRASASAGNGAGHPRVLLSGAGAADLRRELGEEGIGRGPDAAGEWPETAEAAWLGGLVS